MSRRRHTRAISGSLIVLLVLLAGAATAFAAFTATSANPGNTWATGASFQRGFASGSYSGDNGQGRKVTMTPAVQPDFMIVKATSTHGAAIRTRTMPAGEAKPAFGSTALQPSTITGTDTSGFTVGADATTNASGNTYQWYATTSRVGGVLTGEYVGDGLPTRFVSTPGMNPAAIMILPAGAHPSALFVRGMGATAQLDAGTTLPDAVTGLGTAGFTVGASPSANAEGQTYHWVAFADNTTQRVKTGTYTGDGGLNNEIKTVFQPRLVMVRAADAATARNGMFRGLTGWTATGSSYFAPLANDANRGITDLDNDEFQVESNPNVNARNGTYGYVALG